MQNMYDEKGVKMNKLLKYTFMLLCCFLLMGCLPLDKETDKKSIVCTTYAQYNWLQEIIGENNSTFELTLLIKDGADLHSYQPTIQDLAKVSSADLFVYVGGESEQWVSDALKEAKNKFQTQEAEIVEDWVKNEFKKHPLFELEYFVIADESTLLPITFKEKSKNYRAFIAVFVNNIRLIDTITLN